MKREKAEKLQQNNPKLRLYSKKLGEIRSLRWELSSDTWRLLLFFR